MLSLDGFTLMVTGDDLAEEAPPVALVVRATDRVLQEKPLLTTYKVQLSDGSVRSCTTLDEVRTLVQADPEAQVDPVIHFRACPNHRGYEESNCPVCGP